MGEPVELSFGRQSSPGRYGPDDGARFWNCYAEHIEGGKGEAHIFACDGFDLWAETTGGGAYRGGLVLDAVIYVVFGRILYRFDSAGNETLIGGIPGDGPCIFSRNQATPVQVTIISDGLKYIVEAGVLSSLDDPDLPSPNSSTELNGRTIYTISDGRVFWSDIDDSSSVSALNHLTAESRPDGLSLGLERNGDLILFGTKTIEVMRDTGQLTNKFRRVGPGVLNKGCVAPQTIKTLGETIFFVGDDNIVYQMNGYSYQPISDSDIVRLIEGVADKADLSAVVYYSRGVPWYTLSGPGFSVQFNAKTSTWIERFSFGGNKWIISGHLKLGDVSLLMDSQNGKIYRRSSDTFTEAGSPMTMRLRSPTMHAYPKQIICDELRLDFIVGVGQNSNVTDKASPTCGMRYSDDGGRTWSNQLHRSLGRIGEYGHEILFTQLGSTGVHGRIWEIEASSPVIRGLMRASVSPEMASA